MLWAFTNVWFSHMSHALDPTCKVCGPALFISHLFCAAVRQLFFDIEEEIYAVPFTCVSLKECLLRLTYITIFKVKLDNQ